MSEQKPQRQEVDRRRRPRGGRRDSDAGGYTPMVFVIDEDSRSRDISEAILAKLRFAVAPFESLDKAISVLQALRPEVVIAREDHIDRLRATLAHQRGGMIPLVPITKDQGGEALVEEVRRVLRDRAAV